MPPRKKPSRKKSSKEDDSETPAESAGSLLVILGGVGILSLALSPWEIFNVIPKVLGILALAFLATLGGLLLLPPERRGKTAEQMVELFVAFVRAVKDLITRK